MKRILAVLMALCLAAGLPVLALAETDEPVELNIITTFADVDQAFYSTPVYEAFAQQSGVRLTSTFVTAEKFNVILAGGDTTDLIAAGYSQYYNTMASGGMLVKINDMLEGATYLGAEDRVVGFDLLKSIYDGGDGSIYGVINSIGPQGGNAQATNHGTYVKWPYYKEIGAPELEDYYDFIDALAEISALHPTTEDGLPLYGFSMYNEPNQLYPFLGPVLSDGLRTFNPYIYTDFADNSLVYAFLDEEGPYWKAAAYMNYAWDLGIVDPDSFTQTSADFGAKVDNGQVLNHYYAANAHDFVIIPLAGSYIQENLFDIGANVIAIASTCSNPEAAFGMLDYLASPAAGRLIYSGVEEVHWSYDADGVPVWTAETLAARKDTAAWEATGIDNYGLYSIVGVARGVDCGDNGITALNRMKPFFVAGLSDVQADFTAFYSERDGVSYAYPNEVLYARGVKDGLELNSVITKSYGAAPDDIARIDATLLDLAINAVPRLVMASPDQFEAVKADVLKSFEDAGVQASHDYWQGRWAELWEQYGG